MFQVLYEVTQPWPVNGSLRVEAPPLVGEIKIAPDVARRRAKGYLTDEVAMALRPDQPVLVWSEPPMWRIPIYLHLRGFGTVALLGSIDVNAITGTVIPLTSTQIATLQDRADAIATRLTPEAAPAG